MDSSTIDVIAGISLAVATTFLLVLLFIYFKRKGKIRRIIRGLRAEKEARKKVQGVYDGYFDVEKVGDKNKQENT